jgi:pilus assembly protein CpaE
MVGTLDSLSLKNTKLGLETLGLMGYDDDRIKIVLNRADTRVGITPDDVLAVLGRKPDVMIPSDRDIPLTVNEGEPVVLAKPRSEAARAFRALAELYTGAEVQHEPAKAEAQPRLVALFGRRR